MFITSAWANTAASQPTPIDTLVSFLPLVVIFILFWFMIIRPQMQRTKEQAKMVEGLQKGDEVVTSGGQTGRVVKVGEQFVSLEIAPGVITPIQKTAIQTMLPKGTIKDL
ncbi:MAG: preprotein translocase subunit YajC [Betaproteobacteria bacterium]|nr:preprotein translocase subunit YajC [Betaproteobacteria bacterium]